MSVFLGIDAGGTKTDYALADKTTVLARVRGGTIKRMRTDALTAGTNLDEALRQLTLASGVDMRAVARTCIGTAGETVPLVVDWLRDALGARVGGSLLVLGDVEIALEAAFPNEGGVVVIAGTGSNVAGRIKGGHVTTAGGYGPVLADQGSGHRIGQQALRAAFLALDEGRSTDLLEAILRFWKLASKEALVAHANSLPAPDLSELTTPILVCAASGDEVASDVLRAQGVELAYLVRLMIRRLRRSAGTERWTPPLAFTGSIVEHVPVVREALLADVRQEFPELAVREGVIDPIDGAIARARHG